MKPAALLFGTDLRLAFNPDGTRTADCQEVRPRPMTLLECEKRAALQRKADGIPEPGTPRHRNARERTVGPRYPMRKEITLKRFPLGRNLADDRLRSGVR